MSKGISLTPDEVDSLNMAFQLNIEVKYDYDLMDRTEKETFKEIKSEELEI